MTDAYQVPGVDWVAVLPLLIVFGGALVATLVEGFAPRGRRWLPQMVVSVLTLLGALVALGFSAVDHHAVTAGGHVVVDGPSLTLWGTLLVLGLLSLLVMSERFDGRALDAFAPSGVATPGSAEEAIAARRGASMTEIFPLVLFALTGMMAFVSSGSLLMLFVALEIMSLPLYILTGLARRRRLLSQEASLKYFLLGAFSSAFFLFGAVLVYGVAGTMNLAGIAAATRTVSGMDAVLVPGILLVTVGLLFKIGAVPFHAWTPDAYQGAPTPVAGFMAACTKVAAFGALLRVLYVGFEGMRETWAPIVAAIAALTMVVGAVLTVVQTDVKRMLAYSSIAHAGFILVGVLALSRQGIEGVLFYVAAYGFMTIAAFGIASLVRSNGNEATHVNQWAGLARRHPVWAGAMAFLMLAFTGIPLTSGFTAKFAAFAPAVGSGYWWLVLIGVLCSAVTAVAYLRLAVQMYFSDHDSDAVVVAPSATTIFAIAVGVIMTLLLGLVPSPLLSLVGDASTFLR